jgi:hypothetical protein
MEFDQSKIDFVLKCAANIGCQENNAKRPHSVIALDDLGLAKFISGRSSGVRKYAKDMRVKEIKDWPHFKQSVQFQISSKTLMSNQELAKLNEIQDCIFNIVCIEHIPFKSLEVAEDAHVDMTILLLYLHLGCGEYEEFCKNLIAVYESGGWPCGMYENGVMIAYWPASKR